MKSRHSLKDVAKEAAVSVATVSRYLNGTLELPEVTRMRIDAAVGKLNYHPNPHARRLSLGKSDSIALILPDIANPFFSKLAAAIELAAARHFHHQPLARSHGRRSDKRVFPRGHSG